jgi:peptidoglycan/xylan/chitin deacetylase (PgdA/CDA1 family)
VGRRLLVIGYHNVTPTWFWPAAPGAGVDGLARQVRALQRIGTIVPLGEALEALATGGRLPARPIALTFDDGYRDNLERALPVLERLGAPATFFLVPGFLDRTVDAWWETLAWAVTRARVPRAEVRGHEVVAGDTAAPGLAALTDELKALDRTGREAGVRELVEALDPDGDVGTERLFMDWDEARLLAARAEVGSHTGVHAILARETPDAQRADLTGARRRLQDELGVAADVLAYPNGQPGDQDAHTQAAARAAGHTAAVTTVDGFHSAGDDPFTVARVLLDPTAGTGRLLRKVLRTAGARAFVAGR